MSSSTPPSAFLLSFPTVSITKMVSARLRKAFKYPESDSEDGETRLVLDEQEQERLIQTLHTHNEQQNARYKLILMILPILCSIGYLLTLFSPATTAWARFLSIIGIISLLSMGYAANDGRLKWLHGGRVDAALRKNLQKIAASGSVTLAVAAWCFRDSSSLENHFLFLLLVPGVVLLTIWVAQNTMESVDVEVLEKLKYDYKGA
ncbi:hypothetical protein VTO42DRAFT_999 [Malbranchea cinnamomea]